MTRKLSVALISLSLALLAGCMGPPSQDSAGFASQPPPGAGSPTLTISGPTGFALSSGGGRTTSANLKMRARIGAPAQGVVASSANLNMRLGVQADVNDNP